MTIQAQARFRLTSISVLVGLFALVGCAGPESVSTDANQPTKGRSQPNFPILATDRIAIDGSSTVYPITRAIADQYRQIQPAAAIGVEFSGTSAGFRKFCAGETDISNASRPILVSEIEACNQAQVRFIEIPIAFDALTIVVHPSNSWAKDITIAELKQIWQPAAQGKITNWQQVRAGYPDRPLALFGAGKDSGTFDYFNEVLTGMPKQSRTDYTASEDDDALVQGIATNPNALGYIPFAYYEANQERLKPLAVDSSQGPVLPSRSTVEKAQYQPFSRPLFIYVNFSAAQKKPEVRAFVEYYLDQAPTAATTVGYVPLPKEGYHLARVQFQRGEVGTVFEGVPQPDVTIAELLRRQTVFQLSSRPADAATR